MTQQAKDVGWEVLGWVPCPYKEGSAFALSPIIFLPDSLESGATTQERDSGMVCKKKQADANKAFLKSKLQLK